MSKSKNKVGGLFVPHLFEMLESPAFRILSRAALQVLVRIELEWRNHGRKDNGRLPVTFDQFVAHGIHRHAIAPAIRELEKLGFIEITQHGRAGNADWRRPNMFRLTYLPVDDAEPTHEWRHITDDDAVMIATGARRTGSNSAKSGRQKKQKTSAGKRTMPSAGKRTTKPGFSVPESAPQTPISQCRKPSLQDLDCSPNLPGAEPEGGDAPTPPPQPAPAPLAPPTKNSEPPKANGGNGAAASSPMPTVRANPESIAAAEATRATWAAERDRLSRAKNLTPSADERLRRLITDISVLSNNISVAKLMMA